MKITIDTKDPELDRLLGVAIEQKIDQLAAEKISHRIDQILATKMERLNPQTLDGLARSVILSQVKEHFKPQNYNKASPFDLMLREIAEKEIRTKLGLSLTL